MVRLQDFLSVSDHLMTLRSKGLITLMVHFQANIYLFNPLQPGVAFLYPLKNQETSRFSNIFRGYRKARPTCNGLNSTIETLNKGMQCVKG